MDLMWEWDEDELRAGFTSLFFQFILLFIIAELTV